MKLSKGMKRILYVLFGIIMIGGIILVLFPVYQSPIKDPTLIKRLEWSGESVLVITPRFTEVAYSKNGFYDYYDGSCGKECLTVPMQDGRADRWGSYNLHLTQFLSFLGYPMESDESVHLKLLNDTNYLNHYKSIILLHSEYATRELYQGIINHSHVIYLSPNSLYAEIKYQNHSITLIKGHNYPNQSVTNGFGWKHDNSPEEYDLGCNMWKFRDVSNGKQLNCVAETTFAQKPQILIQMKDFIQ